jgi:signal transduction histidine kinase
VLLVTHRSGSLESAVASLRSRNLAVGFAILLLLAASVALIVVLAQRAQRLARLQAEFLAGISHELLTPLAVIRSAADNLAAGVADTGEHAQRYGEMIRRQSRRLSEMVQDALGFAVAQTRVRDRFRLVQVAEVVRRAVETSRPAIMEAGVELIEEIDPGLPPVLGDATALSHGLRNLLMNGLQYGGDGGWLAIRAHVSGGPHAPKERCSRCGCRRQDLASMKNEALRCRRKSSWSKTKRTSW